ncbi:hypothetical protein GGI1_14683, partial [Acidithiobacillus sp. GGI-221]
HAIQKERRFPFWFEVSLARRMTHIPPQAFPAWAFLLISGVAAQHTQRATSSDSSDAA